MRLSVSGASSGSDLSGLHEKRNLPFALRGAFHSEPQIRNILKKFEMESMSEVAACINGLGIIDYLHMKNADHKKK